MKICEEDIKRFWSKVDKSGFCWEWMSGKDKDGYGKIKIKRKHFRTHRIAWMLTHRYCDNIPPIMCVLHACDNPGCVNPRHLWLGTNADNMIDKKEKGRASKGENHGFSKLTHAQILEIRSRYIPYKYSIFRLAKEYKVSKSTIHYIVTRKYWKHI